MLKSLLLRVWRRFVPELRYDCLVCHVKDVSFRDILFHSSCTQHTFVRAGDPPEKASRVVATRHLN